MLESSWSCGRQSRIQIVEISLISFRPQFQTRHSAESFQDWDSNLVPDVQSIDVHTLTTRGRLNGKQAESNLVKIGQFGQDFYEMLQTLTTSKLFRMHSRVTQLSIYYSPRCVPIVMRAPTPVEIVFLGKIIWTLGQIHVSKDQMRQLSICFSRMDINPMEWILCTVEVCNYISFQSIYFLIGRTASPGGLLYAQGFVLCS